MESFPFSGSNMNTEMRYSQLAYVALNVSDLERSLRFYTEILGLQLSGRDANGGVYLRCTDLHHNIVLYEGQPAGVRRVAWEMESPEQVDALAASLRADGVQVHEVPEEEQKALRQSRTCRFADPSLKITIEFFASMQRFGDGFSPTVAKIQRLGHIVLLTPEADTAISWYTERMNFKISDSIENQVTFLRCFPNPYHHSFGIGSAPKPVLHHVNFMVSEIDDIGKALSRFKRNGVKVVWGPGRHPPSDSIFLYFLDPDGMTLEYSFGMEEFPEQGPRRHRILYPDMMAADYWENTPEPELASRGELIEAADLPA